jgi:hypothetical protein
MICAHCQKHFTHDEVKRKFGTEHYADYGCCSEACYTAKMTGIPPLPNPESNQ